MFSFVETQLSSAGVMVMDEIGDDRVFGFVVQIPRASACVHAKRSGLVVRAPPSFLVSRVQEDFVLGIPTFV